MTATVLIPDGNEVGQTHYISQTPFEIYETTNGRNSPVSASNHFLTHRRGRSPIKAKGAWVYPQGPGT